MEGDDRARMRGTWEIDISPDGHEAWGGCRHSSEIGIVDLTQKKMTASS